MARCARRTFSVHDQAKPPARAGASTACSSRLADARVALDEYRRPAPGPPARVKHFADGVEPFGRARRAVPRQRGTERDPGTRDGLTAQDVHLDGGRFPRSTTYPRSVVPAGRERPGGCRSSRISRAGPSTGCVGHGDSSRRSGADRHPPRCGRIATTSPVQSDADIEGSPSAAGSWSPDRIARAARAARTASRRGRAASRRRRTWASPMNFSASPQTARQPRPCVRATVHLVRLQDRARRASGRSRRGQRRGVTIRRCHDVASGPRKSPLVGLTTPPGAPLPAGRGLSNRSERLPHCEYLTSSPRRHVGQRMASALGPQEIVMERQASAVAARTLISARLLSAYTMVKRAAAGRAPAKRRLQDPDVPLADRDRGGTPPPKYSRPWRTPVPSCPKISIARRSADQARVV